MFNSSSEYLTQLIADNEWLDLPNEFVTREGRKAKYVEGKWYLPIESEPGVIVTKRVSSPLLKWAVIKYIIYLAQTVSSIGAYDSWKSISGELRHRNFFKKSKSCIHPEIMKPALISHMEWTLNKLKEERKLWRGYRVVQWYIWCAENFPELGFCVIYARELDEMVIPGNPKGEAVRSGDPEVGALHPLIEIPIIIQALKNDNGADFECIQQRAAVALAQAYGRNSANYIALWEEDLEDIVEDASDPCYVLNMPRIKKGFTSARSDFIVESIEDDAVKYVLALIKANHELTSHIEVNGELVETARPLFRRTVPNYVRVMSGDYAAAFNLYSADFNRLLLDFVKRMDLRSPITGQLMHLTTRRFRYTVGTTYAAMGLTRKELAARLDHSDTQNVQVYFDILNEMTFDLDKAAALRYARFVKLFCGTEVVPPESLSNLIVTDKYVQYGDHYKPGVVETIGGCGLSEQCYLYPPYSCYLCPKFIPFDSDVHEHVLEMLLRQHSERKQEDKIGVHMADVILAVGQVILMRSGGPYAEGD